MKKHTIKSILLLVLIQNILIGRAEEGRTLNPGDTVQFYMKIDTTMHGIRARQEFILRYICTAEFDSITTPHFRERIELIEGPKPHRSSQMIMSGGVKTNVNEYGYSFRVRFMKEGEIALPLCKVKIGGKEYSTPPLTVTVRPPLTDIENVECSLQIGNPLIKGEKTRITLVCNRRPDSNQPILLINGHAEPPSGWGSALSKGEEKYSFYYNVILKDDGRYTFSCSDLTFGGLPYTMKSQTITVGNGIVSGVGYDLKFWGILGAYAICFLVGWLILRYCYKKEKNAEIAPFVLEHRYLPLTVDWASMHYAFPLIMLSIPACFTLFNAFIYYTGGDRDSLFFPLFWCGFLPLVLFLVTYRNQRLKLNFQCVKTSLDKHAIQEAFIQTAERNNWVIDHLGDDCIAAHAIPSKWAATNGEQIFLVFDNKQVWINSINDLNKSAAMVSFGYTKKNLKLLREMLE